MNANMTDVLVQDGVVTLAGWELRMLLDLVGERADTLLASHERTGNEAQLDDALDYVSLFNKLKFSVQRAQKAAPCAAHRNDRSSSCSQASMSN